MNQGGERGGKEVMREVKDGWRLEGGTSTHEAQFSEHSVGPFLYLINFILALSVIPVFKSTVTSNGI